jgi:heavy-metal-associated domain-containing protein
MAAHFHHVPGRLRMHVPEIKGNVANARVLEARISSIKGVSRVESRELTGSIVVQYNPRMVDAKTLISALSGVPPAATRPAPLRPVPVQGPRPRPVPAQVPPVRPVPSGVPQKIAGKLAQAVVCHLLEKAAERAIPLLIAAVGLRCAGSLSIRFSKPGE